ncbi:hypothetical protein N7E70_021645 [Aminobacter sp. NyZ550]|uniref:hypothetical protein n=1 Tax=Aminobacter sp. NyZ550 TaxID=2979870 RepID=UPI0021D5E752|nr:hypothetical protein [Aminobacter sp. NyZ550]WAX94253.1 hypothetical protein N7E70_021645 [Aminobacter sp. NyZ550]
MSDLELRQFHSFLEGLIDEAFQGGRFSVDKIVNKVVAEHPERLQSIRTHLDVLGLRALIRNNCRAKNKTGDPEPDMFGHYGLGKRVAVPYIDELGKNRWDRKPRGELSFDDLDRIRAKRGGRPAKVSKDQKELDEIAVRTEPYRGMTNRVADALAMAQRDGR